MKPLLLSDVMPYINPCFTVNIHSGEMSPIDTYEHPHNYKVFQIAYDKDEDCICIMVEPI
jgi:hypothetical protein